MTDVYKLRETARDLGKLYARLQSMRTSTLPKPEVNGRNGSFESNPPGNWLIMATNVEMTRRLHEVAFNAFADIGVTLHDEDTAAVRLCERIAFNADAIAALDWASDFVDELEYQTRVISSRVNPALSAVARAARVRCHLQEKYS